MKLTEDQKFYTKLVVGYIVTQAIVGYGQYKLLKAIFHIK